MYKSYLPQQQQKQQQQPTAAGKSHRLFLGEFILPIPVRVVLCLAIVPGLFLEYWGGKTNLASWSISLEHVVIIDTSATSATCRTATWSAVRPPFPVLCKTTNLKKTKKGGVVGPLYIGTCSRTWLPFSRTDLAMCLANLWFLMAMTWMGSRASSAKTLRLLRSTIIEIFTEHLIHINSLLDARTFFFEIFFVTYMYIRSKWRNQFRVRDHHIRTRGLFAGGSSRPRPRSPRWGRPRPAPESPCRSRDLASRHLTSLCEESLGRPTVYCVPNVAI